MQAKHHFWLSRAVLGLGFCGLAAAAVTLAMAWHRVPAWQAVALGLSELALAVLLGAFAASGRRTAAVAAEGEAMYRFLADNAMDLSLIHI